MILKKIKRELVKPFWVSIIIHIVRHLTSCGLSSLHDTRDDHCRKFASGFVNNERTKRLMPPARYRTQNVLRKSIHGRDLRNGVTFHNCAIKLSAFNSVPFHIL